MADPATSAVENSDGSDSSLTVWVFRGERVPRAFRVPQRWLRSFLWTVGGLVALSAVLLAVTLRLTWLNQRLNPQHVTALELELAELRKQETAGPTSAEPVPAATPASTPAAATGAPATLPPEAPTGLIPGFYSRLFPPGLTLADRIPVRLDQPRALWLGRRLRVEFAISYGDTDGGSQQGHLLVIARGPETLAFHPPGAAGDVGSPLIAPDHGESFSVSRFREGRAEFGPFPSTSAIRDATILVFDLEGRLLLRQLVVPMAGAAARAAPPIVAPPVAAPPPAVVAPAELLLPPMPSPPTGASP